MAQSGFLILVAARPRWAYRIAAGTDLLGNWLVDVTHGRIGTQGRRIRHVASDEAEARRIVRHCLQRPPGHPGRELTTMNDEYDEILDGLFHGCALAAFLDQAQAEQGWPVTGHTLGWFLAYGAGRRRGLRRQSKRIP